MAAGKLIPNAYRIATNPPSPAQVDGADATTPHGRAMLQMAAVFAELERSMIRERVLAGLARARAAGRKLGRPMVSAKTEAAIRERLKTGEGMVKIARALGVGVSTVQRVRGRMQQTEATSSHC